MPLACVHARHACCTLRGRVPFNLGFFAEACRGLTKVHRGASVVAPVRLCAYTGWKKQNKKKTPAADKVKTTASRTLVYPTPTPPLWGPSRHICVMAPHRSRGLLVCTQCPLIGRIAKSLGGLLHVLWLGARPAPFFLVLFSVGKKHAPARRRLPVFYRGTAASVRPCFMCPGNAAGSLQPLNCLAAGP